MSERNEKVEELIESLGVTEHRAIGFVKVIPVHSLRQVLTQLEAERDEAVRRAVEAERERLAMWAHNNPKDTVEGHDMCIDFNELIEALTPPDSDISSEGNSK